jgi:tetratricopeptide (TPR) repeat protein
MVVILDIAGTAEVLAAGQVVWKDAAAQQALRRGDRFRTGPNSRATLRLSDLSQLRVGELSELEVRAEPEDGGPPLYRLWRGILYFFHRDRPGRFRLDTPSASAAVRGTEFTLEVDAQGRTLLTMMDGLVEMTTVAGQAVADSGKRISVEPGAAPAVTTVAEVEQIRAVQWCLYYPAVLDADELDWEAAEREALGPSLRAYRSGDLLAALRAYPEERNVRSGRERLYHAALLLAVGQVERARGLLDDLLAGGAAAGAGPAVHDRDRALRRFIGIMQGDAAAIAPVLADPRAVPALESLVESYARQAGDDLAGALAWARHAAQAARPGAAGFAWARVAELEFSFGEWRQAERSLRTALADSPRLAPALALRGFVRAAGQEVKQAEADFERALAIDGSLGNAWLGRGLCRIHRGRLREGWMDLQTAALVEPRRALFRSYLGKGYAGMGLDELAKRELWLARQLDPRDPTPWLYAALLHRGANEVNQGIEALERSMELNGERAVYRSRHLLDTDRAVRSSSLAQLYEAAHMPEIGLREAVRGLSADYANSAAHLFVSDSFEALRDPTRATLRYETVWFSEKLLADLLAPAGGTPLSQHISQQEYARLFDQNGAGLRSVTEFRSDGQVRERAAQAGRWDRAAWSLDLDYEHHDDRSVNNGLDRLEWYSTFKFDWTARDSGLLLTKWQDFSSGDTLPHRSPAETRPAYRFEDEQHPIVVGGYHREWGPGQHTLLLGGRLASTASLHDADVPVWVRSIDSTGQPTAASPVGFDLAHRIELEIYGVEAQQIQENERHALIVGVRGQSGPIETHSRLENPSNYAADFPTPAAAADVEEDFSRFSAYAYETLKLPGGLRLTGGLTYEAMRYPANFRSPPVAPGTEERERLGPKAAAVWEAAPPLTFRAAWLQSLGGVSLEESYRLEPTQLAGFVQDYRTLIPESLGSSVSAPDQDNWGAAADLKLPTRTYVTLQGEMLHSEVHRDMGSFDYFVANPVAPRIFPSTLRQQLEYEESRAGVTARQLLGDFWSLGLRYAYVRSRLAIRTPALAGLGPPSATHDDARLHEAGGSALYQHPSGLFGQLEARWLAQQTLESLNGQHSEMFGQLDLFAGYRLPRQRGEVVVGVLNVTGDDYRLDPVTAHPEFPRERVFYARVSFRF